MPISAGLRNFLLMEIRAKAGGTRTKDQNTRHIYSTFQPRCLFKLLRVVVPFRKLEWNHTKTYFGSNTVEAENVFWPCLQGRSPQNVCFLRRLERLANPQKVNSTSYSSALILIWLLSNVMKCPVVFCGIQANKYHMCMHWQSISCELTKSTFLHFFFPQPLVNRLNLPDRVLYSFTNSCNTKIYWAEISMHHEAFHFSPLLTANTFTDLPLGNAEWI